MTHLEKLEIIPIKIDVTNDEQMVQAVKHIKKTVGRIDILINCAGYGLYGAVEDVPLEEAKHQLEVNLFGLARMTQLVLPLMRAQKSGTIVNISSVAGKIATPFGGWYHASKYAVEGLSDSLRNEVKSFGIDVILIEPGGIKTKWSGIANDSLKKYSGNSAYGPIVKRANGAFTPDESKSPGPEVIADLILRAISAKNPRPRYVGGYLANLLVFRRFVSDKLFDRFLRRLLK